MRYPDGVAMPKDSKTGATKLTHAPLVEAILEVHWTGGKIETGVDPSYDRLIGDLYRALEKEYPAYERLPTAAISSEMLESLPNRPRIVQYRFRSEKDKWPLVQLGNGIATLNLTEGYSWDEFKPKTERLIKALHSAQPDNE